MDCSRYRLPRPYSFLPFISLLLIIVLSSLVNPAVASLTKDLEKNQSQIKRLESTLKNTQANYSQAEQQLQRAELALQDVHIKVNHLKSQHDALSKKADTLNTEVEHLNQRKAQQRDALATELKLLYQLPEEDVVKLILNQQDLSEQVRFSHYHKALQRSRLDTLAQYQATLDEVDLKLKQLARIQADVDAAQSDLAQTQTRLKTLQQKRQQALSALKKEKRQQTQQLKHLNNERQTLLTLIADWEAKQASLSASKTPITQAKGKLDWPTSGRVKYAFGGKHPTGDRHWKGIFIKAKPGTPVHAVHGGEVIFANWLRGYGLLCIIEHGQGVLSLYGHNASLAVKLGDTIAAGQQIATIGQSGGQDHAGLYFEIRQKGQPKDPITWLSKR